MQCYRIAGQLRRAESVYGWKARARRRKANGAHSMPVRRVPPWIARVYECKHVSGADEIHFRLAQTVKRHACGFFSFFSCTDKKRTRFPFPKKKKCRFLTDEKTTKRVVEAIASNSHSSAGERIHTARKVLQCPRGSHRPPLPVRDATASGKYAPAGARLP